MALPDLIEIVPLPAAVEATVTVPGSKSLTNRALILAALSEGETVLRGALWSEDTQVMVECLQALGFMVNVEADLQEPCNRTITVYGKGGEVPRGGTESQPLPLFVGNAGTAARFLCALVCLGGGVYRLHGIDRMHQRPQAGLFQALRSLGYRIEAAKDHLPATIYGCGRRPGRCRISIEESSQFASALLLCSAVGGWEVDVVGENAEESPYVAMTARLLEQFPPDGGEFQIEPDASSGSYFWAANAVSESRVTVAHWPHSGWQVDQHFADYAGKLRQPHGRAAELPAAISRQRDLGDSIMTAIVLGPLLSQPVNFTDLGRLRVQECERVAALRTELTRCGARVVEQGDTLTTYPSKLHGADIETYNDHRMAMCFAVLGLAVPGIRLKNPSCVKKTFPNFFQKLTAPPPSGLGVRLLDGSRGRDLSGNELFAE